MISIKYERLAYEAKKLSGDAALLAVIVKNGKHPLDDQKDWELLNEQLKATLTLLKVITDRMVLVDPNK